MPISTNAPFNEFGQSQILRDIEQLYLALNAAGTGSSGDGQTQDQSDPVSQSGSSSLVVDGFTLTLIPVTACINGVERTIYVYGYIAP
jgi:hypothetical protein